MSCPIRLVPAMRIAVASYLVLPGRKMLEAYIELRPNPVLDAICDAGLRVGVEDHLCALPSAGHNGGRTGRTPLGATAPVRYLLLEDFFLQ